MWDGWRENRWAMQAALTAHIVNCHRDSKRPPYKPDQFNPCVDHSARTVTGAELDAMLKRFQR